ncbi:uncharacterized protein LOC126370299 [Pectinophora gossypiella]|uniref:uncharacterized protein LOC126370299 n=1 Tax=Pectinophora gossypiella TaxID=13191 RepID=UPI00214EF04B|nr:uncharacterized protein LOC126370299 [Pectinophora gossypiella]
MKQFIETVKRFPILWNTESKSYHNLNKKDVAWNRIVEEMNNPDIPDVKTAKNEWKKIRDSHRESLKRIKAGQGGQSGQGTLTKNNWKYAEHLEFLLPYMKSRKRPGKVSVNNKIISSSIALGSQNTSPEITETQSTEILDETQHYGRDERSQNGDSISTSKQERQEKRKVGDDSSLRDLLKEVDADFIKWCEQRDKRRAEEAEKVHTRRPRLPLTDVSN